MFLIYLINELERNSGKISAPFIFLFYFFSKSQLIILILSFESHNDDLTTHNCNTQIRIHSFALEVNYVLTFEGLAMIHNYTAMHTAHNAVFKAVSTCKQFFLV